MNIRAIIKKIEKNGEVYIIGRGPTARFYKSSKTNISIGINIDNVNNKQLTLMFNDKFKTKNLKSIKVGSVNFLLYDLFRYLDKKLKKEIKVFIYGFDFRKVSNDEDINKIINKKSLIQQSIDVNSQSIAYHALKNSFTYLKILKMGFSIDDDLNPKIEIKKQIKNELPKQDLKIVAEVTTNHLGNSQKLEALILGCIKSKINYIKFQKRDVLNFYTKKKLNSKYITPISNTFADYRMKLELTEEQLEIIKFYKKKYNLEIIFSALDYNSYLSLKKEKFDFFKIPSTISKHKSFIEKISKEKLDKIIVSTGMTDEIYLKYIIKKFKKFKFFYLLHAVSSYPTYFNDMNINIVKKYHLLSLKNKNIIPGYSSHDVGDIGSMLAVAAGAKMIEKHIKIGTTEWLHFDDTAIDVNSELPNFVKNLNKTYYAMGNGKKIIYDSEHHKYPSIK